MRFLVSCFRMSIAVAVVGSAVLVITPKSVMAQWPPEVKNLQVFPEDIPFRELVGNMRGFAGGLGVRCQFCHVDNGNDPNDLSGFDFSSDEKPTKRKARVMLRMVQEINNNLLADLLENSSNRLILGLLANTKSNGTRPERLLVDAPHDNDEIS